MLYYVIEVC